jgi:autotransporter-associated beta strand protein
MLCTRRSAIVKVCFVGIWVVAACASIQTASAQIVVSGSPNKDWSNSALKLWLRADAGITQTSGTVTSWADQSNSGYTATQSTAANSPTYNATLVGGTAGIAFDGSDFLSLSGSLNAYRSTFIVYRDTSTAAYVTPIGTIYGTPQNGGSYHGDGDDSRLFNGTYTSASTLNGQMVINGTSFTPLAAVGRPDNWTLNAYLASGTLQNRVTTIGADNYSSASRAINGGIAEILMYDNALTSPEVNSVGAYLTGKYSLSTLYGADQSWAGGDSGTWSNTANWSGAAVPTQFAIATLGGDVGAGGRTVTLSAPAVAGGLAFTDSNPATAGGITLTGSAVNLASLTTTWTPEVNVSGLGTGAAATIASVITGSHGMVKTGPGTLVLQGANSFSGTAAIREGAVRIASTVPGTGNSVLGAGSITLGDAATSARLEIASTGVNFGRGIALQPGGGELRMMIGSGGQRADMYVNATISGSGGLTISSGTTGVNPNRVITTVDATYTGATLVKSGAEFQVNRPTATGTGTPFGAGANGLGSAVTVEAGGFLTFYSGGSPGNPAGGVDATIAIGSLAGAGRVRGEETSLYNQGAKTIRIGGDGTSTVFSGVIANGGTEGSIGITKVGAGTLTLSGSSTYLGATVVEAGGLTVNGSLAATALSVASDATLGGAGTIGGPVSILGGGIVAPGTSPGTLTVNNAFSLADTSILNFELNPANTTIGGGINDLITGVTNLTLDGVLNISGTGSWASIADNTSWRLFNYSGALTNNSLSIGTAPTLGAGQSFQINTGTPGQVNLVIVPEPGALVLAGIGVAAAVWVRRRR